MTEQDRPVPTPPSTEPPANPASRPPPPEAQHNELRESGYDEPAGSPPEHTSPPARHDDAQGLGPLFESRHTKEIQQRWHDIQATFVDDPRDALRQAGELNDEVISSHAAALDDRKHILEQGISDGDTEQLRIGLRQYRQMLNQILTL